MPSELDLSYRLWVGSPVPLNGSERGERRGCVEQLGRQNIEILDLFLDSLAKNKKKTSFIATERAGFEPAVGTGPTQSFQGCSISHSDTSPEKPHNSRFTGVFQL